MSRAHFKFQNSEVQGEVFITIPIRARKILFGDEDYGLDQEEQTSEKRDPISLLLSEICHCCECYQEEQTSEKQDPISLPLSEICRCCECYPAAATWQLLEENDFLNSEDFPIAAASDLTFTDIFIDCAHFENTKKHHIDENSTQSSKRIRLSWGEGIDKTQATISIRSLSGFVSKFFLRFY